MKNLLFLSSIACFLILFLFLVNYFPDFSKNFLRQIFSRQISNPAAKYCLEQGGKRLIKKDRVGNIIGFCQLQGGKICTEWSFYQGSCPKPEGTE